MPRQVFTAGEILTAANMNDLSDQTVMVFADSAARGSAIPTPSEGMITYLQDTDEVEKYDGSNFVAVSQPGILQVVSTTKTDTFSTSSTSYVDVTGLSVAITPSSTSSKILVNVSCAWGNSQADAGFSDFILTDGSNVDQAQAASGTSFLSHKFQDTGTDALERFAFTILLSPNTTSALTYKLRAKEGSDGSRTLFVNRNNGNNAFSVSTITAMEVAG